MNPLPFLACKFFKKDFLHSSKTPIFRRVDLILKVKPNIIIILMNTDKKISFLFKIYKNSKNRPILGLPFGLKPIAQRNNIKTSYYVQRMRDHYYQLKIPINSNTPTSSSLEEQPRGTYRPVPAK